MTLLYIDGFKSYLTADLALEGWTKTEAGGTAANITVQTSVARFTGGAALKWNTTNDSASNAIANVSRTFTASASWVIGVAVRCSTNLPATVIQLLALKDAGSVQCDLRLNADGTLSVTRAGTALTGGTSALAISLDAWNYIEWKVTIADSIAANSCKVNVNGVNWINVTSGQDTKATANATANSLALGTTTAPGSTSLTTDVYFTDLYVCDQSGSVNNDFLGPRKVELLAPTGAGNSSGWTPSAGSNYQCVDDATPGGDTDYVETSVATTKDTYAMGDLQSSPATVDGIQTRIVARKTDAGARSLAAVVRSGGADTDGATVALADTYAALCEVRETDPATGVAWTESGVNAMQAGVKLVA